MNNRLLTVYYRHKRGGLCKRLYMMLQAFLDRGWEIHYVAVDPYPFRHPRLHAHILRLPGFVLRSWLMWPLFALYAPFYISSVARREEVGLIAVFNAAYGAFCSLAARVCHIPLVVFVRIDGPAANDYERKAGLTAWATRWTEKRGVLAADLVITVSRTLKDRLVRRYSLSPAKLAVLPNHVDVVEKDRRVFRAKLRRSWGLVDEFVIVTSGLMQRRKRFDFLIRAFAIAGLEKARLLLIGDGEDAASLRKLADELHCAHRVLFVGWRDDTVDLVRGADLFVFPSAVEGSPNSLLEALGCGVPCLVSNVPELREIVARRELVFEPEDEFELALKLKAASAEPSYLSYLEVLSHQAAERHRFDWVGRLFEVIEPVLAGSGEPSRMQTVSGLAE